MQRDVAETLDQYKEITRARWSKTKISVMVFGPSMNARSLGSRLRSYIARKCDEYGVTIRCEHSDFVTDHRSMLGANKNLVFAELDAAKFADAIIIIPDSPGSFSELGMLSLCKSIHEKVIILFKHKYENDNSSFIHEGPKLAFQENHATIEYVDYRRKQEAWQIVEPFLHDRKAGKYEMSILADLV